MAINLDDFTEPVSHKKGQDDDVSEASNLIAYRLDEKNGVSVNIGFSENMLSKADYFYFDDMHFSIIEASDLRKQLSKANVIFKKLIAEFQAENPETKLSKKKERDLKKEAYEPIKSELAQKWSGSIASLERLFRVNDFKGNHPEYSYYIVCRNDTDVKVMDHVKITMQGMCGKFEIVRTEDLEALFN